MLIRAILFHQVKVAKWSTGATSSSQILVRSLSEQKKPPRPGISHLAKHIRNSEKTFEEREMHQRNAPARYHRSEPHVRTKTKTTTSLSTLIINSPLRPQSALYSSLLQSSAQVIGREGPRKVRFVVKLVPTTDVFEAGCN